LWHRDFGVERPTSCPAGDTQGITGSPAVRDDGHGNPLVYLNSPDGYLYELNGLTGATVWRRVVQIPSTTQNDVYAWSSPTLYGGRVYVGISSNCDVPFTRGAVKSYDQVTGKPIATAWTMPAGYAGAGVWTSVAVDSTGAYVTTGSTYDNVEQAHPPTVANNFDQYSIVKFDPITLQRTGKWPAPTTKVSDPDFGSSPVLFSATIAGQTVPMLGACNKDGYFYAVRSDTMKLVWKQQIGKGTAVGQVACVAGGVWDGTRLFVGGNATMINGTAFGGSVRRLDPATGTPLWQTGLGANPLGSGTYDPNGILAYAGTNWSGTTGNGLYLIDPGTGNIMRTLQDTKSWPEFAQPIWVDGMLLMDNTDAIVAWKTGP
jgi:polyvinyl alcohol dehydrogenase (cytochrome)